jgi:hypothetical protein
MCKHGKPQLPAKYKGYPEIIREKQGAVLKKKLYRLHLSRTTKNAL